MYFLAQSIGFSNCQYVCSFFFDMSRFFNIWVIIRMWKKVVVEKIFVEQNTRVHLSFKLIDFAKKSRISKKNYFDISIK